MPSKIIDGKLIAKKIREELMEKVKTLEFKPCIAFVLVGNEPASQIYVSNKIKACEEVGFKSKKIQLDESIDEIELMKVVDELNQDKKVTAFIVQLPLPKHINSNLIIDCILPHKDADGMTPLNLGNLAVGNNLIVPATPKGIIRLIE